MHHPIQSSKTSRFASIRVGTFQVDLLSGAARGPEGSQHLRRMELQLLVFLHLHTGAIISREELLRHVWQYHGGAMTRTVDQTVATLRRKLNDHAPRPWHLITVHGIGYRLHPD